MSCSEPRKDVGAKRVDWPLRLREGVLLGLLALLIACGNRKTVEPPPPQQTSETKEPAAAPPPADTLRLYDDAASLDPLLLTSLASQEGLSALLAEAAREPKHRRVVMAALPYTKRLAAAEYLAQVAVGSDADRDSALSSLFELAARANRNEDAEDSLELRRGCDMLAGFVEAGKGKKADRARALSVLRALAQHGCTPPEVTDLDAQ